MHLLPTLAGAVIGSKKAYKSTALINKAASVTQYQMKANRAVVKLRLVLGMRNSITDYPLANANIDLENYYAAGILLEAYTAFSEQSDNRATSQQKH